MQEPQAEESVVKCFSQGRKRMTRVGFELPATMLIDTTLLSTSLPTLYTDYQKSSPHFKSQN